MKKTIRNTIILAALATTSVFASNNLSDNAEAVQIVKKAAAANGWVQYKSANDCGDALYFKKAVKNKDLHRYTYQSRKQNQKTTLYTKVYFSNGDVGVDFANKVAMNAGSVGIDSKADKFLSEFKNEISKNLI